MINKSHKEINRVQYKYQFPLSNFDLSFKFFSKKNKITFMKIAFQTFLR